MGYWTLQIAKHDRHGEETGELNEENIKEIAKQLKEGNTEGYIDDDGIGEEQDN